MVARAKKDDGGGFLYLIPHKTRPLFKIGVAKDLIARLSGIEDVAPRYLATSARWIDAASIQGLRFKSYKETIELETTLHRLFDYAREPVDGLCADLPFCGRTEWFKQECYARLMDLLDHVFDLLQAEHVTSLDVCRMIECAAHVNGTYKRDIPLRDRRLEQHYKEIGMVV